ncbi:MAG: ComF family protein [Rubripirellula sp.]
MLPPSCPLCDRAIGSDQDFCSSCRLALVVSESSMNQACRRCGVPAPQRFHSAPKPSKQATGLADPGQKDTVAIPEPLLDAPLGTAGSDPDPCGASPVGKMVQTEPVPCLHCRNQSFQFREVVTLWSYHDRVCDAVVAAKYAYRTALGDALGRRLGRRVTDFFSDRELPDVVTYIPSHFVRQFSRGGNGNRVIAQAVARVMGCKCRLPLKTTRRMRKQAWLDDAERVRNVCDAFSLKRSYDLARSRQIAGKHFLVVDDVLTTGATANEVASILLLAGARRVSLAVVARAIRSN